MISKKTKKTKYFFNRKPIITSPLTVRQALICVGIELFLSALFMSAGYVALKLFDFERPDKAIFVAIATFTQAAVIIALLKLYLNKIKISWGQLGLRKPHLKMLHLVWMIPIIFILEAAVMASTVAIFNIPMPEKADTGFSDALREVNIIFSVIAFTSMAVLSPFIEEVIYRSVIYGGLKRKFGLATSILVSSFIFAAFHGSLQLMPYFMVAGITLVFIYEYYKTLWASIFVHIATNSLASLALLGVTVQ